MRSPEELVPRGVQLPWPADGGKAQNLSLRAPATSGTQGTDLRIELLAGNEARLLLREVVKLMDVRQQSNAMSHRHTNEGKDALAKAAALPES
jgi:hypothetical protein